MQHTKEAKGPSGESFTLFFTPRSPFSNLHRCERLLIDGISFSCVEQYYQLKKAEFFEDDETAKAILEEERPIEIKRLGNHVAGFVFKEWAKHSREAVAVGNVHKFMQNPVLRRALLDTKDSTLVECSPSDRFWGIGRGIDDELAIDRSQWMGRNQQGAVLTEIRRKFQKIVPQ
ncbi:hypothetical protein L596_028479 [Steinernema carpocapsae]|uniref:NADAR domain-containing protein n=1 Tax=Steinernema carpocapsae TaxID=34508 RepID=A0A4U5LYK1_STECR|nr:hypothetical protein L596_028479 [Steinernema carpocapsae]